jgi:hypothetical protein
MKCFLKSAPGRPLLAGAAGCAMLAGHAAAGPGNAQCEARVNDTVARLLECIQPRPLFDHLVALQKIADANPGGTGHGNRDTGEPGYKASVDYVAGLVRQAGYKVTIQTYDWEDFQLTETPVFAADGHAYGFEKDWYVARLSGQGSMSAPVQPLVAVGSRATPDASASGCSPADFARFRRGNIALIERGGCSFDDKVKNAQDAGAVGVVLFNTADGGVKDDYRGTPKSGVAFPVHLVAEARIPVVGMASYAVGSDLYRDYVGGRAPTVRLNVKARYTPGATDYNLIADSPFGDPNHVVVVEGHLDAIYGAGILDNGSGSSTILEVALKMAKTPTLDRLRYIWFGGEELGLLGSHYYTQNLSRAELKKIVFDLDADVTATPNYAVMIADPQNADNAQRFPRHVISRSRVGDKYFFEYFKSVGIRAMIADSGNDGTDSNAFSLVGVPNSGIFTQQDCCKDKRKVGRFGGFLGNYEGEIPSFNGGCVDHPLRWCDNIDNIAPDVLEFASKAFAYVTFKIANDATIAATGTGDR